jgi:hypothetical protein
MLLRFGSWLGAGLLLTAVGACSDDTTDGRDSNAGSAGSKPSGGAAGTGAHGGRSGAGGNAGKGGADGGAGARAGAGGAASGGAGDAGAAAGLGGESGEGGHGGTSGDAGDAGSAGSGEPGESGWEECPTADDYVGDAEWPNVLEATPGAIYCATFDESRTLKEELAKKALLRIPPGTYRLPTERTENLGLPICIAFGERLMGVPIPPRAVAYTTTALGTDVSHRYVFDATAPSPERLLSIGFDQITPSGDPFHFTLDGGPNDFDSFDSPSFSFALCDSAEEPCSYDRIFDSCTHESSTLNRHELTLDTGAVVLDLRIGASAASTEPGAFVRAAGTFRGQNFEQTDYFRLIYNPEHHHFERHFAVLFDEPIDGACGLEISGVSAFDEVTPSAFSVDCELDRLETLSVTDFSLTRDP